MKIIEEKYFISTGSFYESEVFNSLIKEVKHGIGLVTWPKESSSFAINPTFKGNGVKPIKDQFIEYLASMGWLKEQRISIVDGINVGPIDVIKKTELGMFAVEWETGNISSSHRALNKLAVGIIENHIVGGILILPVKNLAKYLTDRIGNYEEISPYFIMYQNLKIDNGLLGIISVDYDILSESSPLIPKGQDGNAKNS